MKIRSFLQTKQFQLPFSPFVGTQTTHSEQSLESSLKFLNNLADGSECLETT